MWPFADLTPDQVEARRAVLDSYGTLAQLSAVGVLLAVAAFQWLSPLLLRSPPPYAAVEMQSTEARPAASALAEDALEADEVEGLVVHAGGNDDDEEVALPKQAPPPQSRAAAWLDTPLRKGWKETRRHALAIGVWAAWVVGGLVLPGTGDDYLHLTKRFAHVAASLLPFHYLLGTPSRLSPLPRLFRVANSGAYNPFHRAHAVLLLALLACHAGFYLNFYVQMGLLGSRVRDLDVIMGLSMVTTLTVLAVLARQTVRYNRRPLFVASHVIGAGLICVFLAIHAPPARWYAAEAAVVYLAVVYERVRRRSEGAARTRLRGKARPKGKGSKKPDLKGEKEL